MVNVTIYSIHGSYGIWIIILSCHEILSIFIVYESGWWFGTMEFYDFPFIGNNNPN